MSFLPYWQTVIVKLFFFTLAGDFLTGKVTENKWKNEHHSQSTSNNCKLHSPVC